MRIKDVSLALVLGFFLGSPSWGATIDSVKGDVLINQGSGFRTVSGTAQAKVGDKVMASPGGSARVVYGDGCPVPVNPGRVVTIAAESPCTANAADMPIYTKAPPPPPEFNPWPIVAGAAVVGIGLCIAFCFPGAGGEPESP
jgi:hypothetical protein